MTAIANPNNNTCIRVQDLPSFFEDHNLFTTFGQFGPIRYATVIKRRMPEMQYPVSLGYGFVSFVSPLSAAQAFSMNGFMGIQISYAEEKFPEMPSSLAIQPQPTTITILSPTDVKMSDSEAHAFPTTSAESKKDNNNNGGKIENVEDEEAKARERQLRAVDTRTFWNNFTIYVSGLSKAATDSNLLRSHFSTKCGPVEAVAIIRQSSDEEGSIGVAKIKFFKKRPAAIAILDLDNSEWMGGKLCCEWWSRANEKKWKDNVQFEKSAENEPPKEQNSDQPTTKTEQQTPQKEPEPVAPTLSTPAAIKLPVPIIDLSSDEDDSEANLLHEPDSVKAPEVNSLTDDEVDNASTSTNDGIVAAKTGEKSSNNVFERIQNKDTIFVFGLSSKAANEEQLRTHFAANCGSVEAISILYTPLEEEANVGIAKIKFSQISAAATAIQKLDNTRWMGSRLNCKWWSKTQNRKVDNKVYKLLEARKTLKVAQKRNVKNELEPPMEATSPQKPRLEHKCHDSQSNSENEKESNPQQKPNQEAQPKDEKPRGLWLPKSRKRIASPPPLFGVISIESDKPSEASVLAEHLRNNPDIPPRERIKLVMDFLTKE